MIQNDKDLEISVGRSRKETQWRTQRLRWSDFITKLSAPARSPETLAEYKALSKAQQDELKDVGGYVGGTLKGGRRKSGSVESRCLLALDMDNIPPGQTDEILKRVGALGCAYVIYSTRKHEGAAPRLRVIIPTERNLTAEEYEPAARKMAELIGIGFCDPTTFQPERFMYWPSVCSGAEYVFTYGDHGFIQAGWLLDQYNDWRNISEWPTVPGESKQIERSLKRQQDPTEKTDIVGAFCRVYDIPAAIGKFLPDIYEETDVPGRYTYTRGSTAGGAVLYDEGKFLFSHHATDPAGGRLCNSFDLVRLHMFGDLDAEVKPGTFTHQLPSSQEMVKFANQDEQVRLDLARTAFGSPDLPRGNMGDEWLAQLDGNGKKLYKTAKNIILVLENDPELGGKFLYDKFSDKVFTSGGLPWNTDKEEREIADSDMAGLRVFLETNYGLTGAGKIQDAFDTFIQKGATHAVREYLSGLEWDRVHRLDTAITDYLGAEDSEYVRMVTRKLFCAAVARVFTPGVKYDYLVVLIGAQGVGKSTFVRTMGLNWFSDSLKVIDMRDKTAVEKLMGVWVAEIQEMDGFNRVDSETVKSFLSSQGDNFRPAYGKRTIKRKRQFVLVGTANKDDFLIDETGNRRYFPIRVGIRKPNKSVFTDLKEEIGQIWAEAVLFWRLGEKLYPGPELEKLAAVHQEDHIQEDPREGMVAEFLKKPIPVDWYSESLTDRKVYINSGYQTYTGETMERGRICAAEVWCECFGLQLSQLTKKDTRAINAILARICEGWTRDRLQFGDAYGRQRGLVKNVPP